MGLTEAFYEFFIELSANNQKSWFDENRARYEREVKALFLTFVESVLVKMAAAEQPLLYNKQFYIQHVIDAEDTLRSNFDDYVVEVWKASKGFNAFLQKGSIG